MSDHQMRHGAAKVATIRDVARRAGVAPGTVSNVLTGRKPVAELLRRSVLDAVEALNYKPNQLASSLRLRQTRSIGIIVPDLGNPFFASLIRHVEHLAARDRFQMLLMSSHEDETHEADCIRTLIARQVDGLLIAPTADDIGATLGGLSGIPPSLIIDRAFESTAFDTVAADNIQAAYDGARHLLDLGHRDIVLLATSGALANMRDRIAGVERAFQEAGMDRRRARVVCGGLGVESCRGAIETELRGTGRPSAVFALAYVATLGTVKAIRALELDCPNDVSLLGFDDSDWMTALRPSISTLEQPIGALAETAWSTLHGRLEDAARPAAHFRLRCALRVRESTRAR